MLTVPYEDGCQCEPLRYRCSAAPFVSYTCHCRACQRITSSAFATCIQVPAEALALTKGTPSSVERDAVSGNRLTTHFCGACGSALYVASLARPRLRTVYVGTLDRPEAVDVDADIWTSRRLPWVVVPASHRIFPEAGDWRSDYADDPSRLER
jgi:hypothetical protein